jgi:hypothetical protein
MIGEIICSDCQQPVKRLGGRQKYCPDCQKRRKIASQKRLMNERKASEARGEILQPYCLRCKGRYPHTIKDIDEQTYKRTCTNCGEYNIFIKSDILDISQSH